MKKKIAIWMAVALLLTGCQTQTSKQQEEERCAYLCEIKGNTVVLDFVEYIESDDDDRAATLKHTEDDMPDGSYIYNPEEETEEYTLTDETVYSFLDWGRDFGGTDKDIRITTTDKKLFLEYLQTYKNGKPGMPFFFEIDGDTVVQITEKPMA